MMQPQETKMGPNPYSKNYSEHRKIFGERQAERVKKRKIKKIQKDLIKLFAEIFS